MNYNVEDESIGKRAGKRTPDCGPPEFAMNEFIKPDGGGLRHNALKNRLDLVPAEWPWALADVTTRGSFVYAERNWERGMTWSTMVGCAGRHLIKFIAGQRYDKETGCHHLAMAAWNLLALMSYDLKGVGEDDIRTSTTMKTLEAVASIPIEEVAAAIKAKRDREQNALALEAAEIPF